MKGLRRWNRFELRKCLFISKCLTWMKGLRLLFITDRTFIIGDHPNVWPEWRDWAWGLWRMRQGPFFMKKSEFFFKSCQFLMIPLLLYKCKIWEREANWKILKKIGKSVNFLGGSSSYKVREFFRRKQKWIFQQLSTWRKVLRLLDLSAGLTGWRLKFFQRTIGTVW